MSAALEIPHHVIDLECGCRRRPTADVAVATAVESVEEESEGSVCFSDADGEASCNSNEFYSTADAEEGSDSARVSSASKGADFEENNLNPSKRGGVEAERDCRICHLSLVSSSPGCGGVAIELGCSCKDDLAAAHKHCAETWFKIKGNKICEICNSMVRNVVCTSDIESSYEVHEFDAAADIAAGGAAISSGAQAAEARSCLNGHRFLNFLLACMVFAFVISWLFHFNIPS